MVNKMVIMASCMSVGKNNVPFIYESRNHQRIKNDVVIFSKDRNEFI